MSTPRTAVVAGASGYIGRHLARSLAATGWVVRTIGRDPDHDASWTGRQRLVNVLEGADVLVNLAGRSVSCRYNKRNADAIFSSRVDTTAALGHAVAQTSDGPRLWINASTGTIYRDSRDRAMDEETPDRERIHLSASNAARCPGRHRREVTTGSAVRHARLTGKDPLTCHSLSRVGP